VLTTIRWACGDSSAKCPVTDYSMTVLGVQLRPFGSRPEQRWATCAPSGLFLARDARQIGIKSCPRYQFTPLRAPVQPRPVTPGSRPGFEPARQACLGRASSNSVQPEGNRPRPLQSTWANRSVAGSHAFRVLKPRRVGDLRGHVSTLVSNLASPRSTYRHT
jgi:hypothetical protein